mgnify:FL=1
MYGSCESCRNIHGKYVISQMIELKIQTKFLQCLTYSTSPSKNSHDSNSSLFTKLKFICSLGMIITRLSAEHWINLK